MNHAENPSHRSPRSRVTESLKICLSLTFGWLLSASASFAAEAPVAATTSLDITNAVVTIGLDGSTLSSLGLEVADVQATAAGHRVDPLSVARTGSPSFKVDGGISLRTTVAWDGFRSWDGGALSPRGGRPNRSEGRSRREGRRERTRRT